MSLILLFYIALALSLDAFGVAFSIGLNKAIGYRRKLAFSFSFGFFQFLFSFIGAFAGVLFNTYIAAVPRLIGGAIISTVGILMIAEGFKEKEENILLNPRMYYIMGISVSIDAMVVGFTVLNNISYFELIKDSVFIGVVTFILSLIAFIISRYMKRIKVISRYADYIGGAILIIFGIKMMFS